MFTEAASYVVPLDAQVTVQTYPGLFVVEGEGVANVRVVLPIGEEPDGHALRLPYCVGASADEGCGGALGVEVVGATFSLAAPEVPTSSDCACVVVDGVSNEGTEAEIEALAAEWEPDALEIVESVGGVVEYVQGCLNAQASAPLFAVSGGVAYRQTLYSAAACGGANSYELAATTEPLRGDRDVQEVVPDPSFSCVEELFEATLADVVAAEDGCSFGEEDCCPHAGEASAHAIVSGRRFAYVGDAYPVGQECACVRSEPVSPEVCTSVFDPCGGGEGFVGLDAHGSWWASTDGRAGLSVDADGVFRVHRPGDATPVRTDALGVEASEVVGVEFVPWVPKVGTAMPTSITARLPRSDDASESSWGNLCFRHFKDGRLDDAEAACIEGLLETAGAPEMNATRGALLYSLGRVFEARGDDDGADALYERSLQVRPGNAAVKQRLSRPHH